MDMGMDMDTASTSAIDPHDLPISRASSPPPSGSSASTTHSRLRSRSTSIVNNRLSAANARNLGSGIGAAHRATVSLPTTEAGERIRMGMINEFTGMDGAASTSRARASTTASVSTRPSFLSTIDSDSSISSVSSTAMVASNSTPSSSPSSASTSVPLHPAVPLPLRLSIPIPSNASATAQDPDRAFTGMTTSSPVSGPEADLDLESDAASNHNHPQRNDRETTPSARVPGSDPIVDRGATLNARSTATLTRDAAPETGPSPYSNWFAANKNQITSTPPAIGSPFPPRRQASDGEASASSWDYDADPYHFPDSDRYYPEHDHEHEHEQEQGSTSNSDSRSLASSRYGFQAPYPYPAMHNGSGSGSGMVSGQTSGEGSRETSWYSPSRRGSVMDEESCVGTGTGEETEETEEDEEEEEEEEESEVDVDADDERVGLGLRMGSSSHSRRGSRSGGSDRRRSFNFSNAHSHFRTGSRNLSLSGLLALPQAALNALVGSPSPSSATTNPPHSTLQRTRRRAHVINAASLDASTSTSAGNSAHGTGNGNGNGNAWGGHWTGTSDAWKRVKKERARKARRSDDSDGYGLRRNWDVDADQDADESGRTELERDFGPAAGDEDVGTFAYPPHALGRARGGGVGAGVGVDGEGDGGEGWMRKMRTAVDSLAGRFSAAPGTSGTIASSGLSAQASNPNGLELPSVPTISTSHPVPHPIDTKVSLSPPPTHVPLMLNVSRVQDRDRVDALIPPSSPAFGSASSHLLTPGMGMGMSLTVDGGDRKAVSRRPSFSTVAVHPPSPSPLSGISGIPPPLTRAQSSLPHPHSHSHHAPSGKLPLVPLLIPAVSFVLSTSFLLLSLSTLPIPWSLPRSIPALRTLTSSLTTYTSSSSSASSHVLLVLSYLFLWKQAFSVPGSLILNLLFGALYGPLFGTFSTSVLTGAGSTASMWLAKVSAPAIEWGAPAMMRRMKSGMAGARREPWGFLLGARLVPLLPYALLNAAAGVLGLPVGVFFWSTTVGSIPWNWVTTEIGSMLPTLATSTTTTADSSEPAKFSITEFMTPLLIFKLVLMTVVTLVPLIAKDRIRRFFAPKAAAAAAAVGVVGQQGQGAVALR